MSSPGTRITEFALEKLDEVPVARRIALTRDLAELAPTTEARETLLAMANDLEAVQRRQRLLLLDFKRRAQG